MLSRLISLLRRIPAVEWAFTRLRPLPHSGSIDVAPIVLDGSQTIADVVKTTPACVTDMSAEPLHEDASPAAAAPTADNEAAVSVVAESPSTGICPDDPSTPESPAKVEMLLPPAEEAADSSPDLEQEASAVPDPVGDKSYDIPAEVEPVVVEAVASSSVEIEAAPVDAPDTISEHDSFPIVSGGVVPVVADQIAVLVADADDVAADRPDAGSDDDSSPGIAIAPASANDHPFAAAMEPPSANSPGPIAAIEPAPAVVSLAPIARRAQARPAEPADRAALIRQRWAETGIRMWNPRLHGTGEATLNIQGGVGLLPPAPGETMPRYDKLEFKMLGGQIVCEGVAVEAPTHASQRSFTRLAASAKFERVREPVRERQAALA